MPRRAFGEAAMSNEAGSAIVDPVLAELTEAAGRAFGTALASVVLFGSAAENRLRASSDVNLMILLERVEQAALDAFREPLRAARAAVRAEVMTLTRAELQTAAQLFPVKYSDMRARHRVLAGTDPFERLEIPEAELRRQTREILMNTALRLRERYVRLSIRDEQLVPVIADAAGPLRSAAAALARMEGAKAASPREALANLAAEAGAEYAAAVANLSRAREAGTLSAGSAGATLLALSRLASLLCDRAGRSASRR
jgi:predicted nucleotidyltransferase